jgi:DNA-binding response OmpR family regulator
MKSIILNGMKKIIIVGRTNHMLARESTFMNRASIKVFEVDSNEEAYKVHKRQKADLIVAEMNTPGLSGEALCFKIREDRDLCNVSIILVCGEEAAGAALRCRANDVIVAPAGPELFLEKTGRLINVAKRMSLRAPVAVRVEGQHAGGAFLGYTVNVSASGLLFQAEKDIRKGDRIYCSFILPNAVRIASSAEVVRAVDGRYDYDTRNYGIRFLDLPEDLREAIANFVK